ncbi:MAG TPA: DUF4124 domain-containing protein [Methylomirabilota bacterium]|nr:DUF4124 domain-containing protein [Methylomirabilota bacterium]
MRLRALGALAALALLATGGEGATPSYRYVDEQGNVHYVSRRDQVPERYRAQLAPRQPGEPPAPQLTPNARGRAGVPTGCILRLRGTERRKGSSHSYPSCDACRTALRALSDEDKNRAECFASSIEDELGKRSR